MTIGKSFLSEGEKSRKLMLQLRQTITETYEEVQPEACLLDYPCEYMGPVKQLPMVGKLDKLKDHVKNRLFEYIKKTFPGTNIAADMIEIDSSFHKAVLDQHLTYRFVGRQVHSSGFSVDFLGFGVWGLGGVFVGRLVPIDSPPFPLSPCLSFSLSLSLSLSLSVPVSILFSVSVSVSVSFSGLSAFVALF